MRLAPWLAFCLLVLSASALAAQGTGSKLVDLLDRKLNLTAKQRADVDPIAKAHGVAIYAIGHDGSLTTRERQEKVAENLLDLKTEIEPFLTPEQVKKLDALLHPGGRNRILPDLGVKYEIFFPSGGEARSIFGSSVGSLGVALGSATAEIGQSTRVGYTISTFSLDNSGNSLFLISPQAFAEYRVPIADKLFAFGNISAGPSYVDYSFNTPDGTHFGAKRLGATGEVEVGLRYGQLRLALDYREFTQASGLDFSGLQASLAWIVFRF
jgi:hypothetical protein